MVVTATTFDVCTIKQRLMPDHLCCETVFERNIQRTEIQALRGERNFLGFSARQGPVLFSGFSGETSNPIWVYPYAHYARYTQCEKFDVGYLKVLTSTRKDSVSRALGGILSALLGKLICKRLEIRLLCSRGPHLINFRITNRSN